MAINQEATVGTCDIQTALDRTGQHEAVIEWDLDPRQIEAPRFAGTLCEEPGEREIQGRWPGHR